MQHTDWNRNPRHFLYRLAQEIYSSLLFLNSANSKETPILNCRPVSLHIWHLSQSNTVVCHTDAELSKGSVKSVFQLVHLSGSGVNSSYSVCAVVCAIVSLSKKKKNKKQMISEMFAEALARKSAAGDTRKVSVCWRLGRAECSRKPDLSAPLSQSFHTKHFHLLYSSISGSDTLIRAAQHPLKCVCFNVKQKM